MKFHERLKEIRKQCNMTQKDVYTKLNISPNGYASWEQGRTEPNLNYLCKLSLLFGVSTDFMLGLEDEWGNKSVHISNCFNNSSNTNIKIGK